MSGQILDISTGKGICYAIVKDSDGTNATTSNADGYFELSLHSKNTILVCSNIGFTSDTISVDTLSTTGIANIYLRAFPTSDKKLLDSTNCDAATKLINQVIAIRKKMFSTVNKYEFTSHNRYVIKENTDIGFGAGSIKVDPDILSKSLDLVSNIWKTKPMRIVGISEFTGKGFYTNPDSYSEIIDGQKSRTGTPSSLSSLLGSRRIQDLCNEELRFYDRTFPGPVSYYAINYYKYFFVDTLKMDNQKVFKIYFEPVDKNDPGLIGYLYITDPSNHVVKIDASLNQVANVGNSFENVSVVQQFIPHSNDIYLPLDYRMNIISNYVGVVKIEYELSSLIGKYIINSENDKNYPEKSSLNLLPDSVNKDSLLLASQESVPFTHEEELAYKKIDSIRTLPKNIVYNASKYFSPQYQLDNHFSISGPLTIYQFNHVEGHTLSLSASAYNIFNNTIDSKITLSNGFADKRFKESFYTAYYPNEDRSLKLSINAYNKLAVLFSSSEAYSSFTTTIYSLLSNRDIRNYYYTKGSDFRLDGEVSSFMKVNAIYSFHIDESAKRNTTFSLLGNRTRNLSSTNSVFPDTINSPIYDIRLSTVSLGVNFDFREDVFENNLKRKVSNGHSFVSFGAGILISNPKYLGSDLDFLAYNANIHAELNTFNTSSISFEINGFYSNGPVPFQMQYALPGNISATGKNFTFRTVGVGNLFGDQALTLNLEYNFRKEIYRILPISLIKNLSVNTFFNAAWKNMSDKSAEIMPIAFTVLTSPLLESGFSVGYATLPISLEFAWRLTHIDRSVFRFGINTSIL